MPVFSTLQRAVWDGIAFPISECTLDGELKEVVHEFPYAPGGPVERMARRPYRITMRCVFFDTSPVYGPQLYPQALNELRRRCEAQLVAPLEVPNLGTIRAYAKSWRMSMSNRILNGETVDFTFMEDTTDLFSVETLLQTRGSSIDQRLQDFTLELDDAGLEIDLLQAIVQTANQLFALLDSVRLFEAFFAAKLDALSSLIDRALDEVAELKDPRNVALIESLKNLWASVNDLIETVAGTNKLDTYVVPAQSTLAQVSMQIYGTTNRSQELLSLNTINDPFKIPAGEIIVFVTLESREA